MKLWNLPEILQQTTRHHHDPDAAQQYTLQTAIIQVANRVIEIEKSGEDVTLLLPPNAPLWKRIGLSIPILQETLQQVDEQFDDVLHLIYHPAKEQQPPLSNHHFSA